MPEGLSLRRLGRRALTVLCALTVVVLIYVLAPGLSGARDRFAEAVPGWLALAVALEVASCVSYVLMFRPVFCARLPWKVSFQIGLSEVGVGSIVPASGAGGLALGAWILRRRGMAAERIARRSVAFFLIKSSVNFIAVAIIGGLLALGVFGPPLSLALTALPAALAALVIAAVLVIPRFGEGRRPDPGAGRARLTVAALRRWLVGGTTEATMIVRSRDVFVLAGSLGYWAFDNAVLWATFNAVGDAPPLSVILIGYLIGQLGGLLPLPGGVGGIDGGLIGTLIVYGSPAASTVAAVFAYRLILFWVPIVLGAPAFVALLRRMRTDSMASAPA